MGGGSASARSAGFRITAALLLLLSAAAGGAQELFLPLETVEARVLAAAASAEPAAGFEYEGSTVRRRWARIDFTVLAGARAAAASGGAAGNLVELNLFDDAGFRTTGLEVEPTTFGYSLSGGIEGVPGGTAAVVVHADGDIVDGVVRTPETVYTFSSTGGGVHEIRQADPSTLPECGLPHAPLEAIEAPARPGPVAGPALAAAAPADLTTVTGASSHGSEIDVLVLYTTAAKNYVGGEAAMETRIDSWVSQTNRFLADSGVDIEVRLAHAEELDYEETSSTYELPLLQDTDDGVMDEVHAMRTAVGADLVHVIERWGHAGTGRYCGIAWLMSTVATSFRTHAFGMTDVRCSSLTFAHELGHNMGLNHDRYAAQGTVGRSLSNRPYPYAYGSFTEDLFTSTADSPQGIRTIMAYARRCRHAGVSCSRTAGFFSNPDKSLNGKALGVAGTSSSQSIDGPANAARTLNNTRTTVARFASPGANPSVASLRRRSPTAALTNASSLRWRLAFGRGVKNVTADDFEVAGPDAAALTVTARSGSDRVYDLAVTGLAAYDGEATLGFAADQNILDLDDAALNATWPSHAERTFTLDHTGPAPAIVPGQALGSPFVATITFPEDVTDFDDAADVTATGATVAAPVRSDPRTYTVLVTPSGSSAATIALAVPAGAAVDAAGNRSTAAAEDISWSPSTGAALSFSGLLGGTTAENAEWTSATPTVAGSPVGTPMWSKEGADSDHFAVDAGTGVLTLPGRDFEAPADEDGDNTYEVTARVTDTRGRTATVDLEVDVTDAVESRLLSIRYVDNLKVPERWDYFSSPLACAATDCLHAPGPVGDVTWTKSGWEAALFTLDADSGRLSLPAKDFENPEDGNRDNHYKVRLRATDDDGNWKSRDVTVQIVQSLPRPLAISGLQNASVNENLAWTSPRPRVAGRPIGALKWSVEGADAAAFSVDAGTGVVTMTARDFEAPADEGGDNTYDVTVRVTDDEENTDGVDLEVTVVDVDERPAAPTVDSVGSGRRELAVAWTAPAGAAGVRRYDLRHILTSATDKRDANWTVRNGIWTSGALEYTLSGLVDGTGYDVQVRAVNGAGAGAWSATVAGETLPNRPPEAVGSLSESVLRVGGAAASVTVSGAFSDPDGDALTYAATSGDPAVAAARVSGSSVRLTAVSAGSATVTVTATDVAGSNTAAEQQLPVRVRGVRGVGVDPVSVTVDEGSSSSYRVVLEAEPEGSVTIAVSEPGADLSVSPSSLTFTSSDWGRPQSLTVSASEDTDALADAPVVIRHAVSGGDYGSVSAPSVTATISENDASSLSLSGVSGSESGGELVFTVTISQAGTSDVLVDFATSDGSARAGSDYTSTSGTLTFPEGSTSPLEIRVPVLHDGVDESEEETFTLTLSNVRNGLLTGGGSRLRVTGTIEDDDDPAVAASFGSSSYSVTEGSSVRVRVNLDKDPERTLTLPLESTPLGGVSEADYSGLPLEATFGPGERSVEFLFSATDDGEDEGGEAVELRFGSSLPDRVTAGGPTVLAIRDAGGGGTPPLPPGGGTPPPPPGDDDEDDDEDDDGGVGGGFTPPRAAIGTDAACADGLCRAVTGVPVRFEDASAGSVQRRAWDFGEGSSRSASVDWVWFAPGFFEATLLVSGGGRESSASLVFLVEASEPAGSCVAGDGTRCLQDSRFSVAVEWWTASGEGGAGRVVRRGSNDSGLFSFFDGGNWEMLVKVLDGCSLNGHVWVFGASATDLGYRVTVTDTVTGEAREYLNEAGREAEVIADVAAFAGSCGGRQ